MVWTNAGAADVNDAWFDGTAATFTPPFFLALSTTAPARDGTNITEPVGNGYARVSVGAADFGAATSADPSVVTNVNDIDFAESTGSFGTITHAVLFSAITGGTALRIFTLTASATIGDDTIVRVPTGSLISRL